jgi:hypothetical protein
MGPAIQKQQQKPQAPVQHSVKTEEQSIPHTSASHTIREIEKGSKKTPSASSGCLETSRMPTPECMKNSKWIERK